MEKEIHFLGEQLLYGNIGKLLVNISVFSSLFGALFYYLATKKNNEQYGSIGKKLFIVQAASIFLIFLDLFLIIFNHRYEYYYAWKHSSNTLPLKYMISCFWEGQEGSFLLWMFWHAFLGFFMLKKAKQFTFPVMAILCFAQFALSSMILGLKINLPFEHLSQIKIGQSPFELLRSWNAELLQIPFVQSVGAENYMQAIKDGNGLNKLLQNPWMVIHPPVLFFGFASALIPFAFSLAGLWKNDVRGWLPHAQIWGFINVAILGTGIIMGGWWAYESLNFGGYWAWDPVENASLMPWLIMVAGVHLVLISRNTQRHIFTSHLIIQLAFWMVLYATFLTRSGILGEASVHSFTDLGLSAQLIFLLTAFIVISFLTAIKNKLHRNIVLLTFTSWIISFLIIQYAMPETLQQHWTLVSKIISGIAFLIVFILGYKSLFTSTKSTMEDEKWLSRELWMFVGSLLLLLCLIQVFSGTSLPVFNKIFGMKKAPLQATDYNKFQLWLAMPLMFFMGYAQWLRYKNTDNSQFKIQFIKVIIVTIVICAILIFALQIFGFGYILFLFFATFLLCGNVLYLIENKKWKWFMHGSSIAHAGFAILLIGVLASSVNKTVLTINEKMRNNPETKPVEEVQVLNKNQITKLEGENLYAIYRGKKSTEADSSEKEYLISFFKDSTAKYPMFDVKPLMQQNPKMGTVANPSTKHYLHKDIFTYVAGENEMQKAEPFANFITRDSILTKQLFLSKSGSVKLSIDSIITEKLVGDNSQNKIAINYSITAESSIGKTTGWAKNIIDLNKNDIENVEFVSNELGVIVSALMRPVNNIPVFKITVGERTPQQEFVVFKAIEFPWINLVWLGTIVMVFGTAVAIYFRIKTNIKLNN